VGNEDKVRYLMDNHNIPRHRIFNSRDTSFLRDVMAVTDNRGVDVVLNSLSGELLHASWRSVAEFGTMIEIGKRDFRRRAKLSMEAFEANRTFVGLDLWQVSQVRPEQVARYVQVYSYFRFDTVSHVADLAQAPGALHQVDAGGIDQARCHCKGVGRRTGPGRVPIHAGWASHREDHREDAAGL